MLEDAVLRKVRLTRAEGATGAVTLIQRFGSALNLNIHFHMLFLDGAYLADADRPVFRRIATPSARELQALVERIAERVGRALERTGLIVRDCENSYLSFARRARPTGPRRRPPAATPTSSLQRTIFAEHAGAAT